MISRQTILLTQILNEVRKINMNTYSQNNIEIKYSITVHNLVEKYKIYISENVAPKTQRSYLLTCRKLIEFYKPEFSISDFTLENLQSYFSSRKKTSPKGYAVDYRNLKAFFNWAVERNYLSDNLVQKIKLPKAQQNKTKIICSEDFKKILKFISNEVVKDIIVFLRLSGCRVSEVLNLRLSDVDFTERIIKIGSEKFNTKSRKQRFIPLSDKLHFIISKNHKHSTKFIFCKIDGSSFTPDFISKKFKAAVRKAKLDEAYHLHCLRASFASELLNKNVSVHLVQQLLGHSSVKTTENFYSSVGLDALRDAVSKLDNH